MSTKDAYVEKLKAQLDEWNAGLDRLEAQMRKANAEESLKAHNRITELRRKSQEAQQTLSKIQGSSEDAWEEFREEIGSAWESLKDGLTQAKTEFKRGYQEGLKEQD